jgi:carbon catabolite-derepressing protein kinase
MDLQLYKVDSSNYLVDFRNVGYYRTPPGQPGFSRLAVPAPAHAGGEEQVQEVCSPFLFLDCACRSVPVPFSPYFRRARTDVPLLLHV